MEACIIFPHQLYYHNPALKKGVKVWLVEDDLFFGQYLFHKKKIMLHRASMKHFAKHLIAKGFEVNYVDWQGKETLKHLLKSLQQLNISVIHYTDPTDYLLERRLERYTQKLGMVRKCYNSPNFIFTPAFIDEYFSREQHYFQTAFYIHARKSLNILIKENQPVGGQWTFDKENRKPLPAHIQVLEQPVFPVDDIITEAENYVQTHFAKNPGTTQGFCYPVNYQQADALLEFFLQNRLSNFGSYQDAIHPDQPFLFHSTLSPALNIGLLQPAYVIEKTLRFAAENPVQLNSLEGFIRQIIGWREFIRAVYLRAGVKQRNSNWLNHHAPMPNAFYNATTGLVPVDRTILRVQEYAYAHHIERLMVLGNIMLLCQIHPHHVYKWFMELFIDAYDWVMVPNVYGMSQYADGGLMSTKPYISGSNYLMKMSRYKPDAWCQIWDGLFWRFIDRNAGIFRNNPRMQLMLANSQKLPAPKKQHLIHQAETFLHRLFYI
jgi:deoxyribodipyrimidine photolyase-related protein